MNDKKDNIIKNIATGVAISLIPPIINKIKDIFKQNLSSIIEIEDSSASYENINKELYNLDKEKFLKNRFPSMNPNWFSLNDNVNYTIKLKDKNYILVNTYVKTFHTCEISCIKLTFIGKNRYKLKDDFVKKSLKLSSDNHILFKAFDDYNTTKEILSHDFDSIVLDSEVKNRIINGLIN